MPAGCSDTAPSVSLSRATRSGGSVSGAPCACRAAAPSSSTSAAAAARAGEPRTAVEQRVMASLAARRAGRRVAFTLYIYRYRSLTRSESARGEQRSPQRRAYSIAGMRSARKSMKARTAGSMPRRLGNTTCSDPLRGVPSAAARAAVPRCADPRAPRSRAAARCPARRAPRRAARRSPGTPCAARASPRTTSPCGPDELPVAALDIGRVSESLMLGELCRRGAAARRARDRRDLRRGTHPPGETTRMTRPSSPLGCVRTRSATSKPSFSTSTRRLLTSSCRRTSGNCTRNCGSERCERRLRERHRTAHLQQSARRGARKLDRLECRIRLAPASRARAGRPPAPPRSRRSVVSSAAPAAR